MGSAFEAIPTSPDVPIPAGAYPDVEALVPHCQRCQRCRLGATRTHAAFHRGITRLRGQWLTHRGRPAMAMLHPSYLLRNPARTPGSPKWLMWQDIRAVWAKLDALAKQPDR